MAVVLTPSGTPTIEYGDNDKTIDTLAAAGTSQATSAQIVRYCPTTIVNVTGADGTVAAGHPGVILPSDAVIGDIVQVSSANAENGPLYPESGGNISNEGVNACVAFPGVVRRMSSSTWALTN